jgi:phospholipase C
MLQEGRSFDNYFGQVNTFRTMATWCGAGTCPVLTADADDLTKIPLSQTANPPYTSTTPATPPPPIESFKMISACIEAISPSWNASHVARNLTASNSTTATMDGFAYEAGAFATKNLLLDLTGQRAMGYYDQTVLNFYYYMVTQFSTSDRWFSPVMSGPDANHLFSYAATSNGNIETLAQISAPLTNWTIFNVLQNAGISWKIYYTDVSPTTKAPDTYASEFAQLNGFSANIVPLSQYYSDLTNGTLPAVAMIEGGRNSGLAEQAGVNIQTGATQVETILKAFMNSTAYASSVFILTWADGGGLYDHVAPAAAVTPDGVPPNIAATTDIKTTFNDNFTYTGFRVPLIVISPFAKTGYVSHTVADFTAILKLIEARWGLPTLTQRDAAQFDMSEFFDFANVPNKTPPLSPTQSTAAACYTNTLP